MWVHVVVAVTFKIGERVVAAWTRAIYCGQYQRRRLTGGGILRPYILIVIQAAVQIDSLQAIKSVLDCSAFIAEFTFI